MKTKRCRPVLVYTNKEVHNCYMFDNLEYQTDKIFSINGLEYRLVLVSIEPDEKIEVGDLVYEKNLNTEESIYEVCEKNGKLGFFRFRNVFISFDKQNSAKKIIATQDQIPESYIQRFVEEYNEGQIKDLEIEWERLEGEYLTELDDCPYCKPISRPKLIDGFVTMVDKKEEGVDWFNIDWWLKFSPKERHELSQSYYSNFTGEPTVEMIRDIRILFENHKKKEPILYTKEEVWEILWASRSIYDVNHDAPFKVLKPILKQWFEQNKKK